MSPGTSWDERTSICLPCRITLAVEGRIFFSAATAFSASNSCQKLKIALIMITAMIAKPSWGVPLINASMLAPQSSSAKS